MLWAEGCQTMGQTLCGLLSSSVLDSALLRNRGGDLRSTPSSRMTTAARSTRASMSAFRPGTRHTEYPGTEGGCTYVPRLHASKQVSDWE